MTFAIRLRGPGGADQLEPVEIQLSALKPNEIRIRQTAIGVNFIDIYQRIGLYPLSADSIPGVEAVGVVESVGGEVVTLRVGDRIVYGGAPVGAYAAARNLPASRAVPIPHGLTDEAVVCGFLKGITAHMLLTRVFPVGHGTTMLIHAAAGGLGQLMTRWAVHIGAKVIGTVGSDTKAAIAKACGATHVIVGRDADFPRAVADLTAGRGVDYAIDGIGGTTLAKSFGCVRPFGVVASIGQSAGSIPLVNVDDLGPRRSISLSRPSVMGYMNGIDDYRQSAAAVLVALSAGVIGGDGTAYPLRAAAEVHRDLESGRTAGALYLVPER